MKVLYSLLPLLLIFPCLGMEQGKSQQFPFGQLPLDMQHLVVNELVKKVITQKSEILSKAQSYREYKEIVLKELNSYKSVSKQMKALISHTLQNNKELIPALLPIKKIFWKTTAENINKALMKEDNSYIHYTLHSKPLFDKIDIEKDGGSLFLMELIKLYKIFGRNRDILIGCVLQILDNGANPNIQNNDGKTILSLSADSDDPTLIKVLLNNGAQDIPDNDGCTVLHLALLDNYTSRSEFNKKIAQLIIESPCNKPYLENIHSGLSPILIEITKDQPDQEIIELLLKNGVDPNKPAFFNMSALGYVQNAIKSRPGLTPILELLERYRKKIQIRKYEYEV